MAGFLGQVKRLHKDRVVLKQQMLWDIIHNSYSPLRRVRKNSTGAMTREIDGILSCDDLSLYESVYTKWYDYEEDMERLSRAYPEITVRVNGDGEDSDDLWQDFWHNGKRFSERVRFADYKDIKDKLN